MNAMMAWVRDWAIATFLLVVLINLTTPEWVADKAARFVKAYAAAIEEPKP